MRCLTCDKKVPKGHQACSYCGALVPGGDLEHEKSALTPLPEEEAEPYLSPDALADADPIELETVREIEDLEYGEEPAELRSESTPSTLAPSAAPLPTAPRPKITSLLRFVFPLLVLLIPLFRFLTNDSSDGQRRFARPVLREALFCEQVAEGFPVNPRKVFFLGQDRQVLLYSRWRGRPGNHAYSLRWYKPDGGLQSSSLQASSPAVVIREAGSRGFASVSLLPLEPGMPLGVWRVEVYLDEEIHARLSFQLSE